MPVQIVRPHSIGVASGGTWRAMVLTGAPGVVGRGYGQAQTGTEKAARDDRAG